MISSTYAIAIIAVMTVVTFITRALPFILFDRGETVPKWVSFLGDVLPPAIMSFLLVYCLKSVDLVNGANHGIPEILSVAVAMGLHFWKRNTFLSIGVSTVLYMVLVQLVFV